MCTKCNDNSATSKKIETLLNNQFRELMAQPETQQCMVLCGLNYDASNIGTMDSLQVMTNVRDVAPALQSLFYVLANHSVTNEDMTKFAVHLATTLHDQGPSMLETFKETFNMAQALVINQDPRLDKLRAAIAEDEDVVMKEKTMTAPATETNVVPLH